jgi:hypothetical protein
VQFYADDGLLAAYDASTLLQAYHAATEYLAYFGMTISFNKCAYMVCAPHLDQPPRRVLYDGSHLLISREHLVYLGVQVTECNGVASRMDFTAARQLCGMFYRRF